MKMVSKIASPLLAAATVLLASGSSRADTGSGQVSTVGVDGARGAIMQMDNLPACQNSQLFMGGAAWRDFARQTGRLGLLDIETHMVSMCTAAKTSRTTAYLAFERWNGFCYLTSIGLL